MTAKRKSPQVVAVHWIDAAKVDDGRTPPEDITPLHAVTFGVLIADETDFVRVAGEIFEDGSVRDVTVIPRGMVRGVYAKPYRLPPEFEGWSAQ